jgi:plasmid stabilization system protein ParE
MRRFRVQTTVDAQAQLQTIFRWWRENRRGSDLLRREVNEGLTLLAHHPDAGAPIGSTMPGVRRLLLRRTQYHFYYQVDRQAGTVMILAVWHTARGGAPPL